MSSSYSVELIVAIEYRRCSYKIAGKQEEFHGIYYSVVLVAFQVHQKKNSEYIYILLLFVFDLVFVVSLLPLEMELKAGNAAIRNNKLH